MSNVDTTTRMKLLKLMQDIPYSVDTRYEIVCHIGNKKDKDLGPQATEIVKSGIPEHEALNKIKQLIKQS